MTQESSQSTPTVLVIDDEGACTQQARKLAEALEGQAVVVIGGGPSHSLSAAIRKLAGQVMLQHVVLQAEAYAELPSLKQEKPAHDWYRKFATKSRKAKKY